MNEELSSKLWDLSKYIEKEVNESKKKEKASKIKRIFTKIKVTLNYEKGVVGLGTSTDLIEKDEWQWEGQLHFIEDIIKHLSEYKEALAEISAGFEIDRLKAGVVLSTYVQILIQKSFEGLTDDALKSYITYFIEDLEKSLLEWNLKIWIDGIWLENNEYEIYEGLKIRRPVPSDLEFEYPVGYIPYRELPDFNEVSNSIIEMIYRTQDDWDVFNEEMKILHCLGLFRLGSIFSKKTDMYQKSIFMPGNSRRYRAITYYPLYKYGLNKQDIPRLQEFIERIKPLLPIRDIKAGSKEIDPIAIALQRYNEALSRPESVEGRIFYIMICFEALFLRADERWKLSHKLSQRASALLKFHGLNPDEIYNALKQAYNIRSTYAHGSTDQGEHGDLANQIFEYARISLLMFLQLKQSISKESLIGKLDKSLLENEARDKLKDLIERNCVIY